MKVCFSSLFVVALLAALAPAGRTYNPPGGDNPTTAATKPDFNLNARTYDGGFRDPKTHGVILLRGIDILAGDGQQAISDFLWRYRRELMNGMRQADEIAGYFQVGVKVIPGVWEPTIGKPIPLDTNCHFFNPATGLGLQLLFNSLDPAVEIARALSIAPWQFMTMMGPHTAATDMCNWAYARAVDSMRRGQTQEAMTWLGYALHYLGDVTVPQHSSDYAATRPGANHTEYEEACDQFLDRTPHEFHPRTGGIYNTNWRPDQFVDYAARQSTVLINTAKNPSAWEGAMRPMIPLAERVSAGLMHKFMAKWRNEDFTVVVLTIERARALPGYRHFIAGAVRDVTRDVDTESQADFYARVGIDGRVFQTGVVDGGDDINPNVLSVHNWFFPKWISGRRSSVPISVSLYDKDGGLNGGDDHCDINTLGGKKTLEFIYSLSDSRVAGDIAGAAHPMTITTSGVVSGDSTGGEWPKAEVRFKLERYPTLSYPLTASIRGRILRKGQPAKGVYVFYRDAMVGDSRWERADVDSQGYYRIGGMSTGRRIQLRPAGSGSDFALVPKTLELVPGENVCDFTVYVSPLAGQFAVERLKTNVSIVRGTPAKTPKPRSRDIGISRFKSGLISQSVSTAVIKEAQTSPDAKVTPVSKPISSLLTKPGSNIGSLIIKGYSQTMEHVTKQLLDVQIPWNQFGVLGNGLGYASEGMVYVRMKSWVDDSGNPMTAFSDVYADGPKEIRLPLGTGQYKNVTIYSVKGKPGPGAAGVKVQARLFLGSPATGFREAGKAEGVTDDKGGVPFYFRAGTHVEEAYILVNVVSNPVNPWAQPELKGDTLLFYPARSGDDRRSGMAYQIGALPFDTPAGVIADPFRFRLDYQQILKISR